MFHRLLRNDVAVALAAIALALIACAGQNPVLNACNAYASGLYAAADLRAKGKLTPAVIQTVEQARALANPICEAPNPPSDAASLATVQSALDKLAAAQAGVH